MSAPALTFADGAGLLLPGAPALRVRHRDHPDTDYALLDPDAGRVLVGGRPARWLRRSGSSDADELEDRFEADLPGVELELVVRHTAALTWTQRYVLVNHGDAECVVDELAVATAPGPGCHGWTLTAGSEAFWLSAPQVSPQTSSAPTLAATLQIGEVVDYRDGAWRTGPLRLPAGGRYVVQWQAGWRASPAEVERRRPSVLPRRTELEQGVPAEIAGADTAVLAGSDVGVSREGDLTLLLSDQPGRHRVELRSASGTVVTDVSWVRPLQERISEAGRGWLDTARTSAGIARLPDAAAGLVMQRAVADRLLDQPDPGIEAAELLASRLLGDGPRTAVDIAFLAGEALRTGDPDCAEAARTALLGWPAPAPGIGLAATRVGLAEIAAGRPITELTAKLIDLGRGLRAGEADPAARPDTVDHRAALTEDACRLEFALVAGPRTDHPGSLPEAARAVGAWLGFGLPGRSMCPVPVTERAYAAAVLGLLPDGAAEHDPSWLDPPHAVAEQLRRGCLAELDASRTAEGESTQVLAWLLLGQPIG